MRTSLKMPRPLGHLSQALALRLRVLLCGRTWLCPRRSVLDTPGSGGQNLHAPGKVCTFLERKQLPNLLFWRDLLGISSPAQCPGLTLVSARAGLHWVLLGGAAVYRASSFLHHPRGPLDSQVSCTAWPGTCSSQVFPTQVSGSPIICLEGCLWWLLVSESRLVHHLDLRRLKDAPACSDLTGGTSTATRGGFNFWSPWGSPQGWVTRPQAQEGMARLLPGSGILLLSHGPAVCALPACTPSSLRFLRNLQSCLDHTVVPRAP